MGLNLRVKPGLRFLRDLQKNNQNIVLASIMQIQSFVMAIICAFKSYTKVEKQITDCPVVHANILVPGSKLQNFKKMECLLNLCSRWLPQ